MSEFKGTKGKWYNEKNVSLSVFHPTIISKRICTIICGNPTEEDFSNAKLIACAPEMLEMLENLINQKRNMIHPALCSEIEQLIKKATD